MKTKEKISSKGQDILCLCMDVSKTQVKSLIMKKDFNNALRIDDKNAQAYYYRGGMYFLSNKYKEAIEDYTNAIKNKPNYAYAYNDRGSAKRQQKKF
jgi:tetratricopeptide (TPR) repeat protein